MALNVYILDKSKFCLLGYDGYRLKLVDWFSGLHIKGGPADFGRKFYKNAKKSSLYSQSYFNFHSYNPIIENHPTT